MNLPTTLFVTWADFGRPEGQAVHGDASPQFDDAVDEYAQARADGLEAIVWRIDLPQYGKAGMVTDITGDAEECIKHRFNARRISPPAWMIECGIAAE